MGWDPNSKAELDNENFDEVFERIGLDLKGLKRTSALIDKKALNERWLFEISWRAFTKRQSVSVESKTYAGARLGATAKVIREILKS